MRGVPFLILTGVLLAVLTVGCDERTAPTPSAEAEQAQQAPAAKDVVICGECGQIKGSETCCKPDQPHCQKCGLVKGSPGCCKLPEGTEGDVALCAKCGFIKGSEECCKDTAALKCSSCGLVKGSPGCCKIK